MEWFALKKDLEELSPSTPFLTLNTPTKYGVQIIKVSFEWAIKYIVILLQLLILIVGFLFTAKGHYREDFKSAKAEFKRVFRKYGIPKQIHTDNGTPFGSVRAIQRFTRLSYWFIDLGITPVFSDPAHPEQNGRHERMHRDLKAACAKPASYNMIAQQRKLNQFVKEYNNIRPHEALDMRTPASAHDFATKPFSENIPKFDYNTDLKTLKVTKNGAIRWDSYYWVYVSAALQGKFVGIKEHGNGIWKVFYRNVFLGFFDQRNLRKKEQATRLEINLV